MDLPVHRRTRCGVVPIAGAGRSSPDQGKERNVLLPHALTLAQARSYVAALADRASSIEASSAYEHVLMELDRLHGDASPALDTDGLPADRALLLSAASSSIGELEQHGVDALSVELVFAMLDDAHAVDGS